jgi:hypothetical protein
MMWPLPAIPQGFSVLDATQTEMVGWVRQGAAGVRFSIFVEIGADSGLVRAFVACSHSDRARPATSSHDYIGPYGR